MRGLPKRPWRGCFWASQVCWVRSSIPILHCFSHTGVLLLNASWKGAYHVVRSVVVPDSKKVCKRLCVTTPIFCCLSTLDGIVSMCPCKMHPAKTRSCSSGCRLLAMWLRTMRTCGQGNHSFGCGLPDVGDHVQCFFPLSF